MGTDSNASPTGNPAGLPANQAYGIAAICLLLGTLVGYFFMGGNRARPSIAIQPSAPVNSLAIASGAHSELTMEQMKQMADVQASTLVEKSKADPKNAGLLVQIAAIYQSSHQFKESAGYFERALQIEPKNVAARTQLASCLYYSSDADGALSQLAQALKYEPSDTNALFNLGMIKYRGKNDAKGAIAAWQQLLKVHPDLDRRAMVEKLIGEAQSSLADEK